MGDAVLNEYIYPNNELVHEGKCVFFPMGLSLTFFSTITG